MAPVALNAGEAGIAVQTVVAAAALQLHAVQFWSTHAGKKKKLTKLERVDLKTNPTTEALFPAPPGGAAISSIGSTWWVLVTQVFPIMLIAAGKPGYTHDLLRFSTPQEPVLERVSFHFT